MVESADPQWHGNQPSRDRMTEFGVETGLEIDASGKHGCITRRAIEVAA
jgi:hypothetical protein